ncbi:unnamed protein product [Prorocentrum cordatum]|uniref:Uncharacterized protein n=1 Tax=Prorocentrum cordatum TaxID=2364126 RepID=A0ABN9Q601_9DINO|nr:unnamed protein product [Polarella glacialis]
MVEVNPWRFGRNAAVAAPTGPPASAGSYLQRSDLEAAERRTQEVLKRQMEDATKALQTMVATSLSDISIEIAWQLEPRAQHIEKHAQDIARLSASSEQLVSENERMADHTRERQSTRAHVGSLGRSAGLNMLRLADWDRPADPQLFVISCHRPCTPAAVFLGLAPWLEAAKVKPEQVTINEKEPSKRCYMYVPGAADGRARAFQLAAHLKCDSGRWPELAIRTVEGTDEKLYVNPDKNPRSIIQEVQTKKLLALCRETMPGDWWMQRTAGVAHAGTTPRGPDLPSKLFWSPATRNDLKLDAANLPNRSTFKYKLYFSGTGETGRANFGEPSCRQLISNSHKMTEVVAPAPTHIDRHKNQMTDVDRVFISSPPQYAREMQIVANLRCDAQELAQWHVSGRAILELKIEPRAEPRKLRQSTPACIFNADFYRQQLATRVDACDLDGLSAVHQWACVKRQMAIASESARNLATRTPIGRNTAEGVESRCMAPRAIARAVWRCGRWLAKWLVERTAAGAARLLLGGAAVAPRDAAARCGQAKAHLRAGHPAAGTPSAPTPCAGAAGLQAPGVPCARDGWPAAEGPCPRRLRAAPGTWLPDGGAAARTAARAGAAPSAPAAAGDGGPRGLSEAITCAAPEASARGPARASGLLTWPLQAPDLARHGPPLESKVSELALAVRKAGTPTTEHERPDLGHRTAAAELPSALRAPPGLMPPPGPPWEPCPRPDVRSIPSPQMAVPPQPSGLPPPPSLPPPDVHSTPSPRSDGGRASAPDTSQAARGNPREILWCGDSAAAQAAALRVRGGCAAFLGGRKHGTFHSAPKFARWLFRQERGVDVLPSAVLVAGWREAKPCICAVEAAATGETAGLRQDAQRRLREASEEVLPTAQVHVAVSTVIVLVDDARQVRRAARLTQSKCAQLKVLVAATPDELPALLDAAAGAPGETPPALSEGAADRSRQWACHPATLDLVGRRRPASLRGAQGPPGTVGVGARAVGGPLAGSRGGAPGSSRGDPSARAVASS